MVTTADELIDALGGTGQVAGLLAVKVNTVSMWRVRGLPPWSHLKLRDECRRLKIVVNPALFESKPRRVRAELRE